MFIVDMPIYLLFHFLVELLHIWRLHELVIIHKILV